MSFKLLGTGSPLVDYSLSVTDDFIDTHVPGGKGGTRNISASRKDHLIAAAGGVDCIRTPGGSAANTIRAFARLGGQGALFGKIGNDADGEFFRTALRDSGADISMLPVSETFSTGFCLSLITPDAERTMLSDLGASLDVNADDLKKNDLRTFTWLLAEGYLICEPWIDGLFAAARNAGCKIALDLNNFELVKSKRSCFQEIIDSGIDLLFANQQEVSALFPEIPSERLPEKLQQILPLTVVKSGKDGSMIISRKEILSIPAVENIEVKDTTGAGDFYAAGFFYGLSRELPLAVCGKIGSLCAAEVIKLTGTMYRDEDFKKLYNIITKEVIL
jgi:sugar/nucleoside kinase (ribokinase family)